MHLAFCKQRKCTQRQAVHMLSPRSRCPRKCALLGNGKASMKRSVRTKFLLSQLPLVVALLVLSGIALSTISLLGENAQNILHDNYRSVLAAQKMKESIERMDSGALFLIAGQTKLGRAQAEHNQRRFEEQLRIAEGNITEIGEAESVRQLRTHWTVYQREFDAFSHRADTESLRHHYFGYLAPVFVSVKESADQILGLNQSAMVRKSDVARMRAQRLSQSTTVASLLAIGIGIVASTLLTARFLRPLSQLSQAVRQIGRGELDTRAEIVGDDEIAQLAKDINTMAEQLGRYRRSTLFELIQAQQSAQSIMDSLPDPVLLFDTNGRILNMNQPAEDLLGTDGCASADPLLALPASLREAVLRVRSYVMSGAGSYVPRDYSEAVAKKRADGDRYFLPRATPVAGERGGVEGVTVILQDITRLRRVDELKDGLVATVAHELRTPLTSLRMSILLCLEGVAGPLTAKQTELLHTSREDCERLQAFIDDLLDLARLQAGRLEMRRRRIAIPSLLTGIVAEQEESAAQKGIRLLFDSQLEVCAEIEVDPDRISLVFGNLISNAIRHTPEGGRVIVRAWDSGSAFHFEISDTGPGIPIQYQGKVFEKFFRIPGSQGGAAGLGLSIAKEIIEAHNGTIGVKSEPGSGATFYLVLPKPSHVVDSLIRHGDTVSHRALSVSSSVRK